MVVHFNLQFLNKSMYGKIKHGIMKHIEWATSWYIDQDHSTDVRKEVAKIKKNKYGPMVLGYSSP